MDNGSGKKIGIKVIYFIILSIIILIVGLYIPNLIVLSLMLSPLPMAFLSFRVSNVTLLSSIFITFLIAGLSAKQIVLTTVTTSSLLLISFILVALVLSIAFKYKWNFKSIVLASSTGYLTSFIASVIIGGRVEGVNKIETFISGFFNMMEISFDEAILIFNESGLKINNFVVVKENLDVLEYAITLFIPGILIVFSALLGYTVVMISRYIFRKRGYEYGYIPSFQQLRLSKRTVIIYMLFFILVLIIGDSFFTAALINILFIITVAVMFCGFSVVDFLTKRTGIPWVFRGIIYFLLLVASAMFSILAPFFHPVNILMLVGLIDTFFNIRKVKNTGDEI